MNLLYPKHIVLSNGDIETDGFQIMSIVTGDIDMYKIARLEERSAQAAQDRGCDSSRKSRE